MGANWHLEKWWNTNWALMFWKMKHQVHTSDTILGWYRTVFPYTSQYDLVTEINQEFLAAKTQCFVENYNPSGANVNTYAIRLFHNWIIDKLRKAIKIKGKEIPMEPKNIDDYITSALHKKQMTEVIFECASTTEERELLLFKCGFISREKLAEQWGVTPRSVTNRWQKLQTKMVNEWKELYYDTGSN